MAGINDLSFDDLIPQGVDPELLQAIAAAQKNPAMQQPPKPTKWNMQETRSPLQVLQDEQTQQQGQRPAGPNVSFDDLIPAKPQQKSSNDSALYQLAGPLASIPYNMALGAKQAWDAAAQMAAHATGIGIPQTEAAMAPPPTDTSVVGGLSRGVGQAAASAPLLPGIGPGAGLLMSTLKGAGMGAGMGTLNPVQNPGDNFVAQKLDQAKEGAVMGGGLNVAGRAVARVLSPVLDPAAQLLQKAGVYLTPGQAGGKFSKATEEKASSLPVVGDLIKSSQSEGLDSFNRALYSRTLAPLGQEASQYGAKLPVGNEGIAKVGDYLSGAYDSALAKSVPNVLDNRFQQGVTKVASMVPQAKAGDFATTLQRTIFDRITPGGTLTPSVAKQAESDLGQIVRTYKGSSVADDRVYAQAVAQVQNELRGLVARNNPAIAPQIQAINSGWANLVQLETAGARIGAKEGVVTPAQYLAAVKNSDKSVRDRAFARGEARNQDFAQAADKFLSNRYPDSGTVGRGLLNAGVLGGMGTGVGMGMMEPHTALAMGAAAIPYLPMLRNLMTARPNSLVSAGNGLRSVSPYLGLLGASP